MMIPYMNIPATRARRVLPPGVPDDQAYTEYPIPSISRPQPEEVTTQPIPRDVDLPADIPSTELPVRSSAIPSISLPARSETTPAQLPIMGTTPLTPEQTADIGTYKSPFTAPPKPREPGTGWKGRLAAIGKGALYGMGMGSEHGGAGAMGGALAGAITGAASPKTIARWGTESDQAKWEHTHAIEEKDADEEARRQNMLAERTHADRALAVSEAAQKTIAGLRTDTLTDKKHQEVIGNAQRAQAEHDLRHPGELYPPNVTDSMPWLKGEKAPAKAAKSPVSEYSTTHTGADGNLWGVRKDTGRIEMVKDENGKPFKPAKGPGEISASERFHESEAGRREDRTASKEAEHRKDQAEGGMTKAQHAINIARRVSADPKATQDQIDKSWEDARAVVDEVTSSHPDLLEGGPGEGGYPYVGWKGGKRPPAAAPPARSSAPRRSSTADPLGLFK